jgi:hypothetical protein
MDRDDLSARLESLGAFVGEWSIEAVFPQAPPSELRGRAVFEWMAGKRFLIERWEVPHPDAPDGLAIIGFDQRRETYLQHYFDSRGVARIYEMGFARGVWTLSRTEPDLSPLDFSQRFSGTFGAGRIDGRWEISQDGSTWEHDFELIYTKLT